MNTSTSFTMPTNSGKDEYDDRIIDNLLTCSTRRNSDEEDDGYVPESLASFVHAFDVAFEEAKQNFFETIATPRQSLQHNNNRLDESDWHNTPLSNPANHLTTSAAKRELDIRTEPRAMQHSLSTFAPLEEYSGHEVVLSIGDFGPIISPITAVVSPRIVASPARQKLFGSPPPAQPGRDQSIRETSRSSEEAQESKGSSSPLQPSASKRRTQFIKARKAIASKRVAGKQDDEPSSIAAKKSSNPSPLLQSRLMKGATARLAKKDEEEQLEEQEEGDSISSEAKGSCGAGQPKSFTSNVATIPTNQVQSSQRAPSDKEVVSTMGDSLTTGVETIPVNQFETLQRTPSDKGMASTMGDSLTSDVETIPVNQFETLQKTPSDRDMASTMGDSWTSDVETIPVNQVETLQKTPFDRDMTSTMGDFLMSDVAIAQVPASQKMPSHRVTVSSMADSLSSDESDAAKTQSPVLQRSPNDKVTVNMTGDSLPSDIVTSQMPALQRRPSDKVTTLVMDNSVSRGVRTTQSPVLKRTFNKVTTKTMNDSLTSDSARTQAPALKRAPTSKVARPIQIKSREKENHTSTDSNKIIKPTLDEKIAAARERAKLRDLEREALLAGRLALKSHCFKSKPVQPMNNRHLPRPIPKRAPVSSKTMMTKPRVAVPQSPNFATNAKLGVRKPVSSVSMQANLAQSTDLKTRMVKPRVTVPQSPNFATNSKLGVRKPAPSVSVQTTLAQSTDVLRRVLRSQESAVKHVRRVGLTIPKTPKFATDRRMKQRIINPETPGKMTLAQSNDMHRRGLRTMPAPESKRSNGLTIPKSPKFQTTTKRALPQSTAEKETEVMYYYKSHPFKAAPIMKEIPQRRPNARVPRPSDNAALSLRPGNGGPNAARQSSVAKKEHDEATQYKFHARPMPDFFRHNTSIPKAASRKPQTKAIPFHLSPCPKSAEKVRDKTDEKNETLFRARPLPKTTYEYRPPPKTPPRVTGDSKAPDLATAKRSIKHNAIIQISRARAKALSAEKETMQKTRQREQHEEALKKAELFSHRSVSNLENIKPFDLQSTKRHEDYVKQMEEKKRHEEEERLQQMNFHARSFHPSPAPTPIQSPRTPTQPEPFNISGMDSVESEQAAARKRLLQIENDRKSRDQKSPFKARPVPSSTYTSPSSLASWSSPQVSFRACRSPTRASPSTAEMAQSPYHQDSPSDISDSRDDEIEIEFTEGHTRESDLGHFFANLMNT